MRGRFPYVTLTLALPVLLSTLAPSLPAQDPVPEPETVQAPPSGSPQTVRQLRNLTSAQLADLFACGTMDHVPLGDHWGQMLYLTDRFGAFKVNVSNLVWRGKYFGADDYFSNRWICNRHWLGAYYVIGPSWTDSKPAIILEYPRGTPLFANLHDEIREVAPGLYLGAAFDRCPVKFRGWFAFEVSACRPIVLRPASDVPQQYATANATTTSTQPLVFASSRFPHMVPAGDSSRISPPATVDSQRSTPVNASTPAAFIFARSHFPQMIPVGDIAAAPPTSPVSLPSVMQTGASAPRKQTNRSKRD